MAVYCSVAPNFNHFMAARILAGFFSTVTQAGGLVFIQDIFFFHEHVRLFSPFNSSAMLMYPCHCDSRLG